MVLDAVLAEPGLQWLATEREKVDYFTRATILKRTELPGLAFGAPSNQTRRYFPDKLPSIEERSQAMSVRKRSKQKGCRTSPRCDHPWWFDVMHRGDAGACPSMRSPWHAAPPGASMQTKPRSASGSRSSWPSSWTVLPWREAPAQV